MHSRDLFSRRAYFIFYFFVEGMCLTVEHDGSRGQDFSHSYQLPKPKGETMKLLTKKALLIQEELQSALVGGCVDGTAVSGALH